MDDFLIRALAAGIGVAIVAGPLGAFVVWRRVAYFGGALAHSAMLGVALGLAAGINLTVGVFSVCGFIAIALVLLQRRGDMAGDTLLNVLAHGALAAGLVVIAFVQGTRIDLMAYLFGDILSVSVRDLIFIYGGGAVILAVLALIWRRLLSATLDEDLAEVEGVPVTAVNMVFALLIALVVATAMKVVGLLLVASLLVIPAAAARPFARTPEQMAAIGAAIGAISVAGGLAASMTLDTPAGPSIVVAAVLLFAAASAMPKASIRS
jgi:zinc transport system permease protein